MNPTNDPALRSFVPVTEDSHFPIQNLPYGVFKQEGEYHAEIGVAIGDYVFALGPAKNINLLNDLGTDICFALCEDNLNGFARLGPQAWHRTRALISRLLSADEPILRDATSYHEYVLLPRDRVQMQLPFRI